MTPRPTLDARLDPHLFRDHYWLKSELAAFCRSQGLRTDGPKTILAHRVEASLRGEPPASEPAPRRNTAMPATFTRSTVIGPGWRCSQDLRAFFTAEMGRPFHFDGVMRARIHDGFGVTLGQILDEAVCGVRSVSTSEIAPQFEYNRFVRAFRAASPGARHQQVVTAWRAYRNIPVSERPTIAALAQAQGPAG